MIVKAQDCYTKENCPLATLEALFVSKFKMSDMFRGVLLDEKGKMYVHIDSGADEAGSYEDRYYFEMSNIAAYRDDEYEEGQIIGMHNGPVYSTACVRIYDSSLK